MKIKNVIAAAQLNFQVQKADLAVPFILTCIPFIMAPFMLPNAKTQLLINGYYHVNGSEQVVPELSVLFSFFSVQLIIELFFNDKKWNTWTRQLISVCHPTELLFGKIVVAYSIQVLQLAIMFLGSFLFFHFRINGSWLAFIIIILLFSLFLLCVGIMLISCVDSANTAIAFSNFGGILLAGLGGCLSPVNTFPHWAQNIAKFDPAYLALHALHIVTLDKGSVVDIVHSIRILLLMSLIIGIFGFIFFLNHFVDERN